MPSVGLCDQRSSAWVPEAMTAPEAGDDIDGAFGALIGVTHAASSAHALASSPRVARAL